MSHFTVAVFTKEGQTVEELLAPYQENNMDDCPKEYLVFNDVEEEYKNQFENDSRSEFYCSSNSSWGQEVSQDIYEILKNHETDKYGYWENPNAKWDWYQIGGRWSGLLKLKQGATSGQRGERSWTNTSKLIPETKVDSAKIKDIDFSLDEEGYKKSLRFWELKVEGDTPKNKEEEKIVEHDWYKKEYYSERYDSKEEYAKLTNEFGTYAVITPDGVWHEKGKMGWWGMSSESHEEAKQWNKSFKEMFIDTADPEWTLTVVDCHI